ncbi:hypothetical protein GIB67_034742 [Kingdonia uniflora]|uniref:Uncharacterized protein n=1 Tax=Kingdonia uniflora TaxID=39325 RepID=A0A7J7MLD2_9MAGN|nr:hypothetical protein GIB67_034742 [Kingdonia uniflora]
MRSNHLYDDVWESPKVSSNGGFHGFVAFIGDSTRELSVNFLKNETDWFDVFARWKAWVEIETGSMLKRFGSNGDGDQFCSDDFVLLDASIRIERLEKILITIQWVGVAESVVREIIEGRGSMDDMLVAYASSSMSEIEELWEGLSQLRVGPMDWLILGIWLETHVCLAMECDMSLDQGSYNIAILNCKQGHRKALELLKQEDEKKIGELERQVRCALVQQTANEAMVNQLNQDLAEHKAHIEFLNTRLERVHADVKSKYHMELEDLKDWLLVEQEEKRELIKKLQSAEKELLMFRKKLEEQQRDSTSNRHFETLKQKIMELRNKNEVLKRQLNSEDSKFLSWLTRRRHPKTIATTKMRLTKWWKNMFLRFYKK